MQYRKLGRTDIQVSTIARGCWPFAGDANWGPQDDAQSIAAVHAALDAGINLFDSAEAYGDGRSDQVLGKALVGRRDQAVIATKVSAHHMAEADLIASCERSLRYLQTDYIDLYQLHWPSREIPLDDVMATMEKLRDQGKIRAIGVCNFGIGDMTDLWANHDAETNQLPYSLLFRVIEREIQPMCQERDMGILCYSPIQQGLLAGKFASADDVPAGRARTRHFGSSREGTRHGEPGCEKATFQAIAAVRDISAELGLSMAQVSLAWVLAQPAVTSVLAGARNADQIIQNAGAADITLPGEAIARLSAATETVKAALGTNPDPYEGSANSRYR